MSSILEQLRRDFNKAIEEVSKVIVGQEAVLQLLSTSILACGHTLITGAPGLAKTLAVQAISRVLGLDYSRIQFTPDLLPSDIVGVEILDIDKENNQKNFRYIKGPIFSNIILADEINRATPRTQSALLESMQEQRVTLGGNDYLLEAPFIVFATRNPIDYEGVYPLPEAQLDRFLMEVKITYPDFEQEMKIASKDHGKMLDQINEVISKETLLSYQKLVDEVPVSDSVMFKAITLIRKTRPSDSSSFSDVKEFLEWGAGPRAAYHLVHAARAYSLLYGDGVVTEKELLAVFCPVLRHRLIPTSIFNRSGKEIDELINKIAIDI